MTMFRSSPCWASVRIWPSALHGTGHDFAQPFAAWLLAQTFGPRVKIEGDRRIGHRARLAKGMRMQPGQTTGYALRQAAALLQAGIVGPIEPRNC